MEIEPKRVVHTSNDKHLKSVAATCGITAEELFVIMSEMKKNGKVSGISVEKKKEHGHYSYLFEKEGKVLIRLVCSF